MAGAEAGIVEMVQSHWKSGHHWVRDQWEGKSSQELENLSATKRCPETKVMGMTNRPNVSCSGHSKIQARLDPDLFWRMEKDIAEKLQRYAMKIKYFRLCLLKWIFFPVPCNRSENFLRIFDAFLWKSWNIFDLKETNVTRIQVSPCQSETSMYWDFSKHLGTFWTWSLLLIPSGIVFTGEFWMQWEYGLG